jgi:HSP20 family protein
MGIGNLIHRTKANGGVPARHEQDPWLALHADFDDFFERFFGGVPARSAQPAAVRSIAPRVDVSESETEIVVAAELPGIDEKDVEVSLNEGVLTLRGERKSETEQKDEKGKGYHRRERFYGSFERSIRLPADVDVEKTHASFSKGVLTVTLPKSAESRVRRIEVKAE